MGRASRTLIVDVGIAVVLAALSIVLAPDVESAAVAVLHVAPLVARRRWPVSVAGAMVAIALASVPLGVPMVALGPGTGVATYTIGARVRQPLSVQALVGVLVGIAVVAVGNDSDVSTVVSNSVALSLAWWLGRRSQASAAEAERAIVAERLRIARELHDVVAHAMSVVAVQAGTGRFVIDTSPEVAAAALTTIEEVSREALDELRRLLAVLRDDHAGDDDGFRPAPGLDDLPALVAATTDAGVRADLEVVGAPIAVPAGLGLALYRIAQEALTNVRRHARASRAAVTLTYEPGAVTIAVADDGAPSTPDPTRVGHGITGMRERAEMYGGALRIDRIGGWRVEARLPVDGGR